MSTTAAFGAVALLTAGCLSEGGGGGGGGGGTEGGDGVVEILGNFGGAEEEAFNASLAPFEEESGLDVQYTSSPDFAQNIQQAITGGTAPDIAIFPQPGLLVDIAEDPDSGMVPLSEVVDLDAVQENMVPGLIEATEAEDGEFYGAPMRMAVKSIVWTPKPEFGEAYEKPTSTEELTALTNQIRDSGTAPWCIGIESAQATGWVATDWIEEYVLRIGGPEFYQQWVRHEVPFNHPTVVEAAEAFAQIATTEGNVFGGQQAITSTAFGTAGNPMFTDPPDCYLMRQGNFITSGDFFPSEVVADLDNQVDIFQLPGDPASEAGERPVLLGGDLATAFVADDDEVKQVMEFLTSAEFGAEWAQGGGWLSPRTDFDPSNYPDETTRTIAGFATESTSSVFDGSDLMPGAVGAGSFWSEMTAWLSGQQDLKTSLDNIEASWPAE